MSNENSSSNIEGMAAAPIAAKKEVLSLSDGDANPVLRKSMSQSSLTSKYFEATDMTPGDANAPHLDHSLNFTARLCRYHMTFTPHYGQSLLEVFLIMFLLLLLFLEGRRGFIIDL
jgi:hypothetical protein